MKNVLSLLFSLGFCTLSQEILLKPATAQVTPDGTTNTTVDVSGNDFTIQQGDRAGGNLFHSFSDFSVPTFGSAFFNNAADIVNIFSRVTGGNISNIDGFLRANGSANLFLLNPAGIIFGENARLDIGGSFFSTTADSFLFEDGEFSATDLDNPPLLTINAPIGLNFRDNPGDIVNQSVAQNSTGDVVGLEVTPGNNLTLVGGDINFEAGNATARGGNIELGGLSAVGTVGINDDGSLSFPENVAKADITLTNSSIDAEDINITAFSLSLDRGTLEAETTLGEGGNITLGIDNNLTMRNNSLIYAQAFEEANGGNIDIDVRFLIGFPSQINVNGIITSVGGIIASVEQGAFPSQINGNGIIATGNITITAGSIFGFVRDFTVDIENPVVFRQPSPIFESEFLGINACSGGAAAETSSFIVKGKGGLPPLPTEPFMADALIPDGKPITLDKETDFTSLLVGEIETKQAKFNYISSDIKPIKTSMGDIYPARGIIKTEDGKIILTRYPTDNLNTRTPHKSANCTPS